MGMFRIVTAKIKNFSEKITEYKKFCLKCGAILEDELKECTQCKELEKKQKQ